MRTRARGGGLGEPRPNAPGAIRTHDLPLRSQEDAPTNLVGDWTYSLSTEPVRPEADSSTEDSLDADLATIVDAWPRLSARTKVALLAVLSAAST